MTQSDCELHINYKLGHLGDIVMMRKCMKGIKRRAESLKYSS
jgi:hypothetical protein